MVQCGVYAVAYSFTHGGNRGCFLSHPFMCSSCYDMIASTWKRLILPKWSLVCSAVFFIGYSTISWILQFEKKNELDWIVLIHEQDIQYSQSIHYWRKLIRCIDSEDNDYSHLGRPTSLDNMTQMKQKCINSIWSKRYCRTELISIRPGNKMEGLHWANFRQILRPVLFVDKNKRM